MKRVFWFIRSLIFTVLMVVITPPFAIVGALTFLLPFEKRYYIITRWNVWVIWLAKVICGINYQLKGEENLPDSAAILLCKHQSAWETIFLLARMPRPTIFVLKKELLNIPFFGWGLTQLRMIPIDRSQGIRAFRQVIVEGKDRLESGFWIAIFPEGTRIPVGKKGDYKGGASRLAAATGAPVIPVALNSGECWPKNSFIKKPGIITVSIGKPISCEKMSHDELMEKVEDWIETEMRVISPHVYKDEK